jgi:hypothetical protein
MMRALLPASALVLVVTACGAGTTPAPRVTQTAARVPSVAVVAAQRKEAARREAGQVLRVFAPPPGARPTAEPQGYGGVFRWSGQKPLGEVVDVHRFWSVQKPLAAVAVFVRTHRPRGFTSSGATYGSSAPHYLSWSFTSSPSRYLDVTAVALPDRTVLRVDALALWIYPRSPSETVPSATREVVVTAPKVSRKVTSPAKVAQVRRWFDALPVSPPGIVLACPLELSGGRIRLSFRSAGGAWLAEAIVPSRAASVCDPIGFRTGGHVRKPLVDHARGPSFVQRLQQLLDVRLT